MKTIEVKEKNWPELCQRIEQQCRGGMVSLETDTGSGSHTAVIDNEPLQRLTFDEHADPCNANLVIEAGGPGNQVRHLIVEPIRILLRNGKGTDHYNTLQIMAESGTTTMELRPGFHQELVDGLG